MAIKKTKIKKPAKKKTIKKKVVRKKTSNKKAKKAVRVAAKKKIIKKAKPKSKNKTTKKKFVKKKSSITKKARKKVKAVPKRKKGVKSKNKLDNILKSNASDEADIAFLLNKNTANKSSYKKAKPKISPHLLDLSQKAEIVDEGSDSLNSEFNETYFKKIKLSDEEIKCQYTKPRLFVLPVGWARALTVFIIVCLLLAGPIHAFSHFYKLNQTKDKVLDLTKDAYSDLKIASSAISEKNPSSAQKHFNKAERNFDNAKNQLDEISSLLQPILKIVPYEGKTLSDAQNLLEVGENISLLGQIFSESLNYFYNDNSKITDKISYIQIQIQEALPLVDQSTEKINLISPNAIPEEFADQFVQVKSQIHQFNSDFHTLDSFTKFMMEVLGHKKKKRYLIIFQNNRELRPTGGFMGSVALVDFYKGEIKNIEIPGGGTYDFQGTLYESLIPPQPLLLVNNKWEMQDSNWFFDFPTSAQKIEWFFQKAGGATVDGIIAINASLIEQLLDHIPPIEAAQYGKIITAENFIEETQKSVELEYDREENKPKQFIADITPQILESIFSAKDATLTNILKTLNTSFSKKEILMYLNDPELQKMVVEYNWAGEVKQTSKDYLAIVDINMMGGKTSHVMHQKVELTTNIDENGTIINNLRIEREHKGDPDDIFENMTNTSYLKIFVPQGSQLIKATGFSSMKEANFYQPLNNAMPDQTLSKIITPVSVHPLSKTEIYTESGKTVFANWIQTPINEKSTIELSYALPFRLSLPEDNSWLEKLIDSVFDNNNSSQFYSLFIQKQPGMQNIDLKTNIILPDNYKIKWLYPEDAKIKDRNKAVGQTVLNTDELIGLIFELKDYVK